MVSLGALPEEELGAGSARVGLLCADFLLERVDQRVGPTRAV